MLTSIEIHHFKSIESLKIELGRINVFIGENGAGKSNILEAIAFVSAGIARKLDNEFLSSRGIRTTRPEYMHSAFDARQKDRPIEIAVTTSDGCEGRLEIVSDGKPYPQWKSTGRFSMENAENVEFLADTINYFLAQSKDFKKARKDVDNFFEEIREATRNSESDGNDSIELRNSIPLLRQILNPEFIRHPDFIRMREFLIFTPEDSSLRSLDRAGQIEPLGIKGEGLFKLLRVMDLQTKGRSTRRLSNRMKIFSWLKNFKFDHETSRRPNLLLQDNYISSYFQELDHQSANEGFLFALFYMTLLISDLTPRYFAVDNIDASLNPKLCERLMEDLVALAKSEDKQLFLTTHNAAILDGIDLNDDEQRLFVVSRNRHGRTSVRRIEKKSNEKPIRLSQLFIDGLLGGLPKNF